MANETSFEGSIKSIGTVAKWDQDGEKVTMLRLVLEVQNPDPDVLNSLHILEGHRFVTVRVSKADTPNG